MKLGDGRYGLHLFTFKIIYNFSNYCVIGLRNCLLDIVWNNNGQDTFRTMKFEVSKLICEKITRQ